jgi:hypothetical protein
MEHAKRAVVPIRGTYHRGKIMKRSLLVTAFILALATAAAPATAAVMVHPFGDPYYPENAPSPPSVIFEPAPSYFPPASTHWYQPLGYGRYYKYGY